MHLPAQVDPHVRFGIFHSFKSRSFVGLALSIFGLLGGFAASAQEPIQGDVWAHDPSTMIKDGNRYYIYRTSAGIMSKWSTDKVNWTSGGQVFPSGPPAWVANAVPNFENNTFWAPDIAWFNGKYHLYYSCSSWGSQVSAIGLVTSTSLISPDWQDQGAVIQSTVGSPYNCIDPSILVETNGNVWMTFGSYWNGIYLVQLDPATGKRISPNSPTSRLADYSSIEASCLFHRGDYYYLFVNHGTCCDGVNSTYHILVGRSANITGPYQDRDGAYMVSGGGTLLLQSEGRFIGPGHAGIMSEDGIDWFTYHYYDGEDHGVAKLGLTHLQWTADGWPFISNDWSSLSAFYTFEADARDHLALNDGILMGGAAIQSEENRGNVLNLDGADAYVELPAAVANGNTFAAWVKWNGGDTWQRIFDFGDGIIGNSTGRYVFLSPRASSGKLRFAITTSGNGNEQIIDAPAALPTNAWTHVAVTVGAGRGVLYLNGVPVGTNTSMTIEPWELLAHNNYLGKSQWPDPLFDGKIDSFRVYGRVLAGEEIRELAHAPPMLAHRYSFTKDASDSIGSAHGTLEGNAVVTNGALVLNGVAGDYVELPGGLVSGCDAVTFEFWASFRQSGTLARVFDFGDNAHPLIGLNYICFSPNTGSGNHRFSISTSGGTVNQDVPGTFNGETVHVVCIADPAAGYTAIYTNGVLESEMTGSVPPLNTVSTAVGYLGRSLWKSHAWLNASIDEFRIYDGRLSAKDILANFRAGPDALAIPVALDVTTTATSSTFRWPDYAVGFQLESAPQLDQTTEWQPIPGTPLLNVGRWQLTVPNTNASGFFRLNRPR